MSAAPRAGARRMRMTGTRRGNETTPAVDAAAVWRGVDPEAGDPAVVCPACGPRVAASWRARVDVTVRTLEPRPAGARCGVCDPEGACG